jgi:leucyl-tRNA synthetase
MFIAAPDKLLEWSDAGIEGSHRFLNRVITLSEKERSSSIDRLCLSKMHRTIKEVTDYTDSFQYNKAIISIMEFVNHLSSLEKVPREALKNTALLLSPFTPHLSEELWEMLGEKGFISVASWPACDEAKIDYAAEEAEQSIENTITDLRRVIELAKITNPKKIKLIVGPNWKFPFYKKLREEMEKTRDIKLLMNFIMADKDLARYGAEISKIIPSMLKDPSKMPNVILSVEDEKKNLESAANRIRDVFKAEVVIETADTSKEPKARQASPGKPAIVVE